MFPDRLPSRVGDAIRKLYGRGHAHAEDPEWQEFFEATEREAIAKQPGVGPQGLDALDRALRERGWMYKGQPSGDSKAMP